MSSNTNPYPKIKPLIICLAVGLGIWFSPHPEGIKPEAWHLLAIFVSTIVAVIVKPLPMGAVTMIALVVTVTTKTLTAKEAFEGFNSHVVWLIVMALFIARGFAVTGLGSRLAYIFTALCGKHPLGLSYGLMATDLMMAPAVPSVTARSAGVVYPIMREIAASFGSLPNSPSSRKLGGFLTITMFQVTVITSTMFVTAMAANPLILELIQKQGIELNWGKWATAAIVPGIISLILVPLFIYIIYPPEIKDTKDAPKMAKAKLKEMGPLSLHEWIMVGTLILLLVLWIFGDAITIGGELFSIRADVAAMIGLSVLLLTGVLNWNDLIKDDSAWETFFWFSILLTMAGGLKTVGLVDWFSNSVSGSLSHLDWKWSLPVLVLAYFYSHYFFASSTAHAAAMMIPFVVVCIALGAPPMYTAFLFAFASNLFGGLTHYSLGPAPLLFGSGFVDIKDWWRIGFVVSLLNILIWGVIGSLWWSFLGYI